MSALDVLRSLGFVATGCRRHDGRDAIISNAQAEVWPTVGVDHAFVQMLQAWNRMVVKNHAKSFAKMGEQIVQALEGGGEGVEGGDSSTFAPAAVGSTVEKADKRLTIIRQVLDYKGLQVHPTQPWLYAYAYDRCWTTKDSRFIHRLTSLTDESLP